MESSLWLEDCSVFAGNLLHLTGSQHLQLGFGRRSDLAEKSFQTRRRHQPDKLHLPPGILDAVPDARRDVNCRSWFHRTPPITEDRRSAPLMDKKNFFGVFVTMHTYSCPGEQVLSPHCQPSRTGPGVYFDHDSTVGSSQHFPFLRRKNAALTHNLLGRNPASRERNEKT